MEQFAFDHDAFSKLFLHLFHANPENSESGIIDLAGWMSNPWVDHYEQGEALTVYDEYINRVQDKIIANHGLTPERAATMDAVDRWQWYLRHPEMRSDPNGMTDAQIKQEIANLLGIRG